MSWYRDHVREFVAPALSLMEMEATHLQDEEEFCHSNTVGGKPVHVDKEFLQITNILIESEKPVLLSKDYKLMLDCLNALENRAKGKAIILPGRDVWPFYVLMQKRKSFANRIHYFPWMSRNAMSSPTIVRSLMEKDEISKDYLINNCYLFDTGFAGSIFKGIFKAYNLTDTYGNFSTVPPSGLISCSFWGNGGFTCILQRNEYRSQVLKIENDLPKYFESGDKLCRQQFSSRSNFMRAARLTYDLWHGITIKSEKVFDYYVKKEPTVVLSSGLEVSWCDTCNKYHI